MAGKGKDYIDWDEYFMNIAILTSLRSKDPHNQVGACIVKNKHILSCGYNGAPKGFNDDELPWDSLGEETNDILQIKNTFVIHAESNAIDNFYGIKSDLAGSTLYVTWFPCFECAKRIAQNNISKVVYARMYSYPQSVEATYTIFKYANVEVEQYKNGVNEEQIKTYQKTLSNLARNFAND